MKNIFVCLKNLFKIAKLISVDDSGDLRSAIVSFLGKQQRVMLFTPYGIMSSPPASSLTILWSQQGQESNGIGISDDPKNRILKNLKEGEIALGNYKTGSYILFDENGGCQIVSSSLTHNGTNIGDDHTHSGVTTGGGNTGVPN